MSLPDPNQKRDILEIIDRGDDILDYFRKIDPICSEIGTGIALGEKLGEGAAGTVFKVDSKSGSVLFEGQIPSRLVVKKIDAPMIKKAYKKSREGLAVAQEPVRALVRDLYEKLYKEDPLYDADSLDNTVVFLPRALVESCQLVEYERTDTQQNVKVPKGSIFCSEEITEFIISLFVAEFYKSGKAINFIDTFYFATCAKYKAKIAQYYIFMEQIDRTFLGVLKADYPEKVYNHIYVQTLFAIAMYQKYKIVHGDLHADNVFLLKNGTNLGLNKTTEYNGVKWFDADYLEYKIKGKSLYLPGRSTDAEASQFIVKIGDWGRAIKYSTPMIGSKTVLLGEQFDSFIPNWYSPAFDVLVITRTIQVKGRPTAMINKVTTWIENVSIYNLISTIRATSNLDERFAAYPNPLLLETRYSHVDPISILLNEEFMGDYTKPPPEGSVILRCGEID